jgi:hypothetical protein
MSLRQFCGICMRRSSAHGSSTGLPGESRWRTKASVIARELFLSTFGQCNDSIISSWLGSAATAEQIERIAQANRRTNRHLVSRIGIAHGPGVARRLRRLHKVDGNKQSLQRRHVLEALSASHIFQSIVSAEDVGVDPIRMYTC